ncbi:MAG TPA: type II CAAX endopeptidase family protein [Ktedonosporobacter sp.]|nr:type II CAAX endopeptidase family protein [Ktedonosporobacter sp.]
MTFLRRLLSFSITQLVIEVLFIYIIAGLIIFLVPTLHLPRSTFGAIVEGLLVLGTVITFLFARVWIERRPLADLGLSRRHLVRDLLLGFLLGLLLQSAIIGILALAGWYHVTSIASGSVAIVLILQGLGFFLLVGLFEEGVFRGIIFRLLERSLGSWIAIIISALFFGLTHLFNPGATLLGALAIALEGGILLGAAYMLTRSLWLAIGIHWAWNFFEGPFFGATISGTNSAKAFITSTISGPQIWTGGNFGPEAGLVALLVGLVAATILLTLAVQRRQVIAPSWVRRATLSSDAQAQPAP